MSKFISSEQLWDKISEKFTFPNSPKGKDSIVFQEEYGKFTLNHYNTGFGIKYSSFIAQFYDDTILENRKSYDSSFLCFNTGENLYLQDATNNKKVNFEKNICWNGIQTEGHLSNSLFSRNKQVITHFITFDNNLYKELLENNSNYESAKQVYKGEYINVNFNNIINSKQITLLNDLLKIPTIDNKLQMLYLESKLLDLVYTSINLIEPYNELENIYLNSKDIECLHKAKLLLIENMNNPFSLHELARKSAINEFKLKKGFKQLFGNTVFGFLQEYRLEEAKKLLETNDININEASSIVGYKSVSHFSKIFKEYYGVNPIEMKKESKRFYISLL